MFVRELKGKKCLCSGGRQQSKRKKFLLDVFGTVIHFSVCLYVVILKWSGSCTFRNRENTVRQQDSGVSYVLFITTGVIWVF